MNQMVRMGVMFAILLAIGIYATLSSPDEAPAPAPVAKPTPTSTAPKASPPPMAPVKRAATPKAAPAEQVIVDATPPEMEPDAAPPAGPYAYGLGRHKILLKGEGRRFLTIEIELVMDSAKAQEEVRRRRRQLVRQLFFLCSKRQADGTAGASGESRLKADLHTRFGNAIKSGDITELNFVHYEVSARPAKDAGAE